MKILNFLFLLFLSITAGIEGSCFDQNTTIVNNLAANNVRLVVLYNFQSTHNVLDIVSAIRSPGYSLTELGLAQLNATIPNLAQQNISYIYTAPAFRTQQTTNLLGKAFNIPITQMIVDSRLGTQNFGLSEGQNYDIYKVSFGSETDMLEGNPLEGETSCSVYSRTADFLTSLVGQKNQTILIVTHAFNYCHISKILTGTFDSVPLPGTFHVYYFNISQ